MTSRSSRSGFYAKDTFQRLNVRLNQDGSIAIDPYYEASRRCGTGSCPPWTAKARTCAPRGGGVGPWGPREAPAWGSGRSLV